MRAVRGLPALSGRKGCYSHLQVESRRLPRSVAELLWREGLRRLVAEVRPSANIDSQVVIISTSGLNVQKKGRKGSTLIRARALRALGSLSL